MIDTGIIITGIIGIITTIVGSWASWFYSRKKFNSEVNSNEIKNLKDSLEFYESIVKDNNTRLQFYIELSEDNRLEVYRLKDVVYRIINNSCLEESCIKRKFYTEEQIKSLLGEVTSHIKDNKDEVKA